MPDAPKPRTVRQRHVRARSWQVTLILTLFFCSVAGAAGIGWWYARESPAHQGPIVLITVDGLAASALDAPATVAGAGETTAAANDAPALAALAHDAVIFDRAYIHSPELLPAHVSLLSGQLPYEHGVRDDAGFAMRPETLTLPTLLRNRGFSTGAAVSSFLLRETTGVSRGFTTYAESEPQVAKSPDGGVSIPEPTTDSTIADALRSERAIEAATTWATAQHGQRYFMMLQVDAAHADEAVDKVVASLREHRLYDGSTIVLVGDRGKVDGTLDEQTLHVPMLVKQPQREGAGRHVKTMVQHIDVLPTILDLVRAPLPAGLGGRSLKPLLTETSGRITGQPVYSESLAAAYRFSGQPNFALTLNDFRLVRGDSDTLVPIAGDATPATAAPTNVESASAATTSGELPLLRAALGRMLKDRPFPRATTVRPRDRDRLAAEGVLPGLQTLEEGIALTQEQQDALAETHREAARLLASGRLPQALRTLEAIARTHPTLAAVHYQIGTIANELGRTADAVAAFQRAAELRSDAPEIGRALALALLKAGRLAEAEAQIDMTLETAVSATEKASAHDIAARIALAMNQPEVALAHADAVQSAAPSVPMHAFVQGQLLANNGETEEASRVLRGAAAMLRQHETALEGVQLALGRTLAFLKQPADAEAAFRAELDDFPRSVAAYSELGQLLHNMDRDEDAAALVTTLLAAAPTPEGYSTAARLWTLLGETARAAEVRSDARARFPWEPSPSRLARVKPR